MQQKHIWIVPKMNEHQICPIFESSIFQITDYRCSGHHHKGEEYAEQHEIVLPRSGTYTRYDASGWAVADANQVLFFHQNQPYQISHPVQGADCSTIIVIEPRTLVDLLAEYDPAVEDRRGKPFPAGGMTINSRYRVALYSMLRHAQNNSFCERLAVEEALLCLMGELVAEVYTSIGKDRPKRRAKRTATKNAYADIARQTQIVIGEQFQDQLSIGQIAQQVNSSAYHLCRIFKWQTGISIHTYLHRVRLLHALDQLAEQPHINLTVLALNSGFSNHSHFSTAFLSEFGLTPSQFRAQMTKRAYHEMRKN